MASQSNLPIIDWPLALKLSGNNKALAQDILTLIIKTLPKDISQLRHLYEHQCYPDLLHQTHKLHGALSYSGLSRLKNLLSALESNLKNNIMQESPELLHQLEQETDLLLQHPGLHLYLTEGLPKDSP